MTKLTYLDCITHLRKHKDCFKMDAIAKQIGINRDYFRQIVSQTNKAKEMPEKYRSEFIRVMEELTRVEEIEGEWISGGVRD